MEKTAVFLMNLGGPRNLAEVEPYLYELFADPLVVTAPFGPFRPLFAKLISKLRAPSSSEKYQLIGGRSPLVEGTEAQARALQDLLGPDFTVQLAMRCGHPNTQEGIRAALAAGAEQAVSLPLYPQFANATTTSSLREMRRLWPREKPLFEICSYPDHPRYLEASAAALRDAIARVKPENREKLLVVFSAHGLPMSQVNKGDPYPEEIERSARGTAERAGVKEYQVTYQSKVGPARWLGPDTSQWLEANSRGRAVVTHPLAFVSEHLETLYDMDMLAAEAARKGGALEYHRAAAVGVHPEFMGALADLVRFTLERAVPAPRG